MTRAAAHYALVVSVLLLQIVFHVGAVTIHVNSSVPVDVQCSRGTSEACRTIQQVRAAM